MQGIPIRQIACGGYHTVILQDNNDVLVFGWNDYGQLGLGHNDNQNKPITLMQGIPIRKIACGEDHTIILQDNNDVLVFGDNRYGQLGLGHYDEQNKPITLMQGIPIRQITCVFRHTIILQDDNDVLVFGRNSEGQLGLGHNDDQNKPVTLMHNIAQLHGYYMNDKWSPERHHRFSVTFRNRIRCFLLIHKRNHNNTGLKIPEFALFEIFKKV